MASDWSVDANEAMMLTLFSPWTGKAVSSGFHPNYTYPIYGQNQAIYGYKDLSVQLLFACDDMEPCVEVTWAEKAPKIGEVEAEDVVQPLEELLPKSAFNQEPTQFLNNLKLRTTNFTPPGVLHCTFDHDGKTYEIWRSNLMEEKCREMIARMQVLVLLYIEAGSYINIEDEEWTTRRWDVFFLYQKPAEDQYSFAGYCTLYRYFFFDNSNPDLLRVRLSQFIILPPYQREGHGSRFYDVIMQYYLEIPEVCEITIEDPSEEFSDLRDKHDMRRLKRDPEFSALTLEGVVKEKLSTEALRKRSKMPVRQFLRCVEMQLFKTLSPNDSKKRHKMFRLLVKGRIYKQHVDVMAQLDRLERIDKLDETFHHVKDDYHRLVGKMSTSEVEARAKRQTDITDDNGDERPSKRARVGTVDEAG